MKLIGLAAPMRCGKDTIADYLVAQHGFLKFAFSDGLYDEVQAAFGLPDQTLLRGAETKEVPQEELRLDRCNNSAFAILAERLICAYGDCRDHSESSHHRIRSGANSPRQILQWWGTEYRRAQDPEYWIKRAGAFVEAFLERKAAGELPDINGLVNTTVRFPNELEFIRSRGGEVWHVYRREAEEKYRSDYVSEQRLPVAETDREIFNNSTIEKLHTAVSLMLSTDARFMSLE